MIPVVDTEDETFAPPGAPTAVYGPDEWRPLAHAPLPAFEPVHKMRCAAIKNSGDQCEKWAMAGTLFCMQHGGATVSTQAQARRRLDQVRSQLFNTLVDAASEAVGVYVDVMRHGKKDTDKLRAADSVLKLLGFDDSVAQVPGGDAPPTTPLDDELVKLFRAAAVDRLSRVIDVDSQDEEERERDDAPR